MSLEWYVQTVDIWHLLFGAETNKESAFYYKILKFVSVYDFIMLNIMYYYCGIRCPN